jgi:5'-nucleotidase
MKKPTILVTNDDGITAPGIRTLVDVARKIGRVVVVAPDSPQSGKGHALTLEDPIRLKKSDIFKDIEAYECSGTPVDCVKLAKSIILKDNLPDLCISGVNHGSNVSINILYSGTMSAAMEAAMEGIPSIGFSLLDFSWEADFSASKVIVDKLVRHVLDNGIPHTNLLNVNIPKLSIEEIKGIRICRQAEANWEEDFQKMDNPRNHDLYWLTGQFINHDQRQDTDVRALSEGYVSVVPCQFDLTAEKAKEAMSKITFK